MSHLSQRLARLRESGLAPKVRDSASRNRSIIPPESGWSPLADDVWERRVVMPAILPDKFEDPFVLSGLTRSEDLVFYDLETTGLSGGAGNIAFLIGIGRQSEGEFVVTQIFLADYPGEPAMLERYRDLSGSSSVQISYNGRSFDSQVLKTRFLLNRMPPVYSPQVDLLYPSRRMWSSL
ncbi:MAG: ribonuclease H-like domain-containing protein, partial [Spirochaetaceae bacterium]|nr:ribonuclease H-like domain-containing protein [Spirochaetaceae bacterium]